MVPSFGKYPILIPQKTPDAKEAGGDEESNVGRDTDSVEAPDNQVVEYEADAFDKQVAADVLHLAELQAVTGEGPVTLHDVVQRPANSVGDNLCR